MSVCNLTVKRKDVVKELDVEVRDASFLSQRKFIHGKRHVSVLPVPLTNARPVNFITNLQSKYNVRVVTILVYKRRVKLPLEAKRVSLANV